MRTPALLTVSGGDEGPEPGGDPHPHVVSVRQRRDYRVPSVAALLRLAEEGRAPADEDEVLEPVTTVGEAVLELLQSGDGSLGMLDVPELEPLDGVVIVAEVGQELSTDGLPARARRPTRTARPCSGWPGPTGWWAGWTSGRCRTWHPDGSSQRAVCCICLSSWLVREGRQGRRAALPAQQHLTRAVAEELDPGELPAGVLGRDRELHRRGHPVDMWW